MCHVSMQPSVVLMSIKVTQKLVDLLHRGRQDESRPVQVNSNMSRRTLVVDDVKGDRAHTADCPATSVRSETKSVDVTRQFETLLQRCADNKPLGNFESGEIILQSQNGDDRYLLVRVPIPQVDQLQLSPREREIVRMIAKGHPNKVIARVLDISVWTVGTYVRRVFSKLGVASRASMIARLHELGFLYVLSIIVFAAFVNSSSIRA